MPQQPRKRVLSGIQPSGKLHIGNYLGAIRQWVAGQDERENFFCIVDLHAITVPYDPQELRHNTRETAALLLACGIDPHKSVLFVQSHVRAHAELAWIFNCITPLGRLYRMTQFKAKSEQVGRENINAGLLTYPVLQAADILLYDADEVPVGEDQVQHIELTRDIAERFNRRFGETFKLPVAVIPKTGARIMGLDDPTKKMSKSITSEYHAIYLTDDPDRIRKVVRRAVTDPGREIVFSDKPEKAGINNLLTIYQAFTGKSKEEIEAHFAGKGYGELKQEVAEVIIESLRDIQERYRMYKEDPALLDKVLAIGAEKARAVADAKMEEVKEKMGFLAPLTVG